MAISPISPRMRRMRWIAIGLATAAIALNYVDRSTLAVGNIKIREEFGISATAIGALGSAWALTYGIAQLPSGYLLDRIGPKVLVGAAMILWSLCQAAGGIASTYFLLMLSRIGLGRLPGDIVIQRGGTSFYFPLVTCMVISIGLGALYLLAV